MFCKKGVIKNFAKFTGKQLCWSVFCNKIEGLCLATLLKKILQNRCEFGKILLKPFLNASLLAASATLLSSILILLLSSLLSNIEPWGDNIYNINKQQTNKEKIYSQLWKVEPD